MSDNRPPITEDRCLLFSLIGCRSSEIKKAVRWDSLKIVSCLRLFSFESSFSFVDLILVLGLGSGIAGTGITAAGVTISVAVTVVTVSVAVVPGIIIERVLAVRHHLVKSAGTRISDKVNFLAISRIVNVNPSACRLICISLI